MTKPTASELYLKVSRALTFVRLNINRLSNRGDKQSRDELAEFKNTEEVIMVCTGRK